jgi:hypothetical protein
MLASKKTVQEEIASVRGTKHCIDLQMPVSTVNVVARKLDRCEPADTRKKVHLGMIWTQCAMVANEMLRPYDRDGDWLASRQVAYSRMPLPSADLLATIKDGSLGGAATEIRYLDLLREQLLSTFENILAWPEAQSEEQEVKCANRLDAEGIRHLIQVICGTIELDLPEEKKKKFILQMAGEWKKIQFPEHLRAKHPALDGARAILDQLSKNAPMDGCLLELKKQAVFCELAVKEIFEGS